MGEWGFLGVLFDHLQEHSTMLGRFWLLLMLVFRILILGTVASDLFEDEQEEFACNTLQLGCKQVCYDMAFPISQYRFWVFHIVLIATPSLLYLMYAMHHHNKRKNSKARRQNTREVKHLQLLYIVNVAFRIAAEVGFLVGQWWLYNFEVKAQFPCSRFPCPYTVDCFTSRPAEKTVFLRFYFAVGLVSVISSCVELLYSTGKWFCCNCDPRRPSRGDTCACHERKNFNREKGEEGAEKKEEGEEKKRESRERAPSTVRMKGGSLLARDGLGPNTPSPEASPW